MFRFQLEEMQALWASSTLFQGLYLRGVKGCQKNHAAVECPNKGTGDME